MKPSETEGAGLRMLFDWVRMKPGTRGKQLTMTSKGLNLPSRVYSSNSFEHSVYLLSI